MIIDCKRLTQLLLFIVFNLNLFSDNEDWGGMCAAGKRQSPVDLAHDAAIKGEFPGFILQGYDNAMREPIVVNNGHSSKWKIVML